MSYRLFRRRRRLEVSSSVGRADSYRRYSPTPYRRVMPPQVKFFPLVRSLVFRELDLVRPVRESSRRLAEAVRSGPTRFARLEGAPPARRPVRTISPPAKPLYRLAFENPRLVMHCLRRRMRREVLHALGIAGRKGLRGRGGGYSRRVESEFHC